MTNSFDLMVIGAGMAGVTAANKCASAGWRVGIVDELPYGGTCALRGCDPKKMLRRGAEVIDAAHLLRGKGIVQTDLKLDWADLIAFKRTFTDAVPKRIEAGFARNKIEMFHGSAKFVDRTTIDVDGDRFSSRHFLIATGAQPRRLGISGEDLLTHSDAFMELETLPGRIVFVGGGFISFEFAHIAARAGARVTIFDHGSRPLKGFDPDLVAKLVRRSEDAGIEVRLNTEVDAIESRDGRCAVHVTSGDISEVIATDIAVHGAGRVAAIENLDLDKADVQADGRGVKVHDHLQSVSNPQIHAAGDAASTPGAPLTPVGVFEGKVAASNMLGGNKAVPDYRGVPSAVFTIPELTRVGMLEDEATAQEIKFRVKYTDTSEWYSNFRVGETCAGAKILIDEEREEIVGAHLLGPESSELINFLGLAMRLGLKTKDLRNMVTAYPSVGSDLGALV